MHFIWYFLYFSMPQSQAKNSHIGEQALRGEGHTLVGGGGDLGMLVLIYSLSRKIFIFSFSKLDLKLLG